MASRVQSWERLREVWFAFDDLKRWESRLSGRRIRAVEPRGKAMPVPFSGGVNLYSHNQLYGHWYVTVKGAWLRTNRQLHAAELTSEIGCTG
jgi:endonuclease-8